jgi:hypothetical protein
MLDRLVPQEHPVWHCAEDFPGDHNGLVALFLRTASGSAWHYAAVLERLESTLHVVHAQQHQHNRSNALTPVKRAKTN